jgi:Lar family restriction alleviation protein
MIAELEEGITLEPCPFCGFEAVLKTTTLLSAGTQYWVKCTNPQCGASPAANPDKQVAIKAWNGGRS